MVEKSDIESGLIVIYIIIKWERSDFSQDVYH